jgi:DNA-binding NarL/FixJ family response regulator
MSPSDPITIVIADDHPIFLRGLRSMLESGPGLRVVGEAHDGAAAWLQIQNLKPAVAILDLDMPQLNGLQVARRVARHQVPVRLVMLTMHRTEDLFREAIELGVLGYLLKDDMAADVIQCIKAVTSGQHFIAPGLSSWLVRPRSPSGESGPPGLADLSPTQREVVNLISRGMTSKEIAAELGISYRTVENHRFRIAEKLGLKGSNSLLRFALERKTKL